ncbi:hypothetical protein [Mucilaginibacter sp.]|uniref:toxin-antitoxin system YwqK family antitoxin n=1 Tax=Mucilaginibacter sp. TaxID=1882438 RepID=UPI003266CA2E
MKFKVENGSNHISIGLSDIGSYFRFDYPLSLVWNDNRGSVGKYFCLLPYSQAYRDELRNKLLANLNEDFSNNIEELYDLLGPLFSLFKNGEYSLNFSKENIFQYQTSRDNYAEVHYYPLELAFTDAISIDKLEDVKQKHQTFLEENAITKKFYASDILDYTTHNLYDASHCFFATQPDTCIDQNRVNHFEQQISAGELPFVIIMQASCYQLDLHSSYFIIDGHHKLLAYQKLGIYPSMALITYLPASSEEMEFDAEKLATLLYPWQIADLLENWDEKDTYVTEKLKNPNSPLHQFIKNGLVREYYEDRKLKHEAFYINDRIEGKSAEWYENGQLKYERFYSNGKNAGVWRYYDTSGNIHALQPYGETGHIDGELIYYHKNGQKQSSQFFSNGKYVDGTTSSSWFENGDKEGEVRYLNGQLVERKNWNSHRQLVNHDLYDDEQKQWVKKPIAANCPPQNKQNQPPGISPKNLNIIRERQYPETSYKFTWRIFAVVLLMLLQLMRMCH